MSNDKVRSSKFNLLNLVKYFIVGVLILTASYSSAQDIFFSQMQMNPLFQNPANTGNFTGNWRASVYYRNQHMSATNPHSTATAGFDAKLRAFRQKLGVGFIFINDDAGVGRLNYNKAYPSLSYAFAVNNNNFNIGIQPGFVTASTGNWGIWNRSDGNFNGDNGEIDFTGSASYMDINAGAAWNRKIARFEATAGINITHLNTPKMSFTNGEDQEEMLMLFYANLKVNITDQLFLDPSVMLFSKDRLSLSSLGTLVGYKILGNKSALKNVYGGLFIRNGIIDPLSTISMVAGLRINKIDLGISYDLSVGQYEKVSGSTGAFEIAIIYRSVSTVLNSYSIPCERF